MLHLSFPLVQASLAFVAGLLCGLRVGGPPLAFASAAFAAALWPLLQRWVLAREMGAPAVRGALLAALAAAGAGLGSAELRSVAADCRSSLPDGAKVAVRGGLAAERLIARDPAARNPLLPLEPARVLIGGREVARCTGTLRVRLPWSAGAIPAGSELEIRGEWRRLPGPVVRSPWPLDPAYRGFVLADSVRVVAGPSYARHPLLAARGRLERQLHRLFPAHGSLAEALLLGRRETLDREVADRFAKTGLVHLLAISGSHVALLGAALLLLGRIVRVPRGANAWLTIGLIATYLAVIGAPPSAVRAGIMMALVLVATLLQRPFAFLPIVAAAAMPLLAIHPLAALDIGFQLSFAGVLGIVLLRGAVLRRLPGGWTAHAAGRWATEAAVVSVVAFVATAPIVAHHFGQVAPISVLANLPAVPLTSLALVGVGAAVVVEPVFPPLGRLLADGASVALDLLGWVVEVALRVPGGHAPVARPRWGVWLLAGVAFLAALELGARLRARVRWAVAGGSVLAAALILPLVAAPLGERGVEIHFLDVGQGDAVAIRTPAGRWVLVDAGPTGNGYDAGERRVLPFLLARGAQRLEALVLTHPHADHIGGAAAVLRALPVGRLVEPGLPFGSPVYLETLESAEARGVQWSAARQGRRLSLDGVEMEILWPVPEFLDSPGDANEISAVIQLRYGGFSALFTGDASDEVERRLVERYGDRLRVDVLKAGHHGSRTSSSEALLERARPDLVVVSAGRRNRYGHPHPEVLRRLERRGIPVARTDRDGTVSVIVDAGGAEWRREGR